ncbi:MAG: thioredoxin [Planctomyces sp.]|nr:thioredoxin [Planctomyces sp.]
MNTHKSSGGSVSGGIVYRTSTSNFSRDVLQSEVPVLVDFYADWCGPCRMLSPILERLAGEFGGRIRIVKVNVDDEPQLAGQYSVNSIPTLMFVKSGQILGKSAGAPSEASLRQILNQLTSIAA